MPPEHRRQQIGQQQPHGIATGQMPQLVGQHGLLLPGRELFAKPLGQHDRRPKHAKRHRRLQPGRLQHAHRSPDAQPPSKPVDAPPHRHVGRRHVTPAKPKQHCPGGAGPHCNHRRRQEPYPHRPPTADRRQTRGLGRQHGRLRFFRRRVRGRRLRSVRCLMVSAGWLDVGWLVAERSEAPGCRVTRGIVVLRPSHLNLFRYCQRSVESLEPTGIQLRSEAVGVTGGCMQRSHDFFSIRGHCCALPQPPRVLRVFVDSPGYSRLGQCRSLKLVDSVFSRRRLQWRHRNLAGIARRLTAEATQADQRRAGAGRLQQQQRQDTQCGSLPNRPTPRRRAHASDGQRRRDDDRRRADRQHQDQFRPQAVLGCEIARHDSSPLCLSVVALPAPRRQDSSRRRRMSCSSRVNSSGLTSRVSSKWLTVSARLPSNSRSTRSSAMLRVTSSALTAAR